MQNITLIDPLFYKHCADQIFRICVLEEEVGSIFIITIRERLVDTLDPQEQQQSHFNVVFIVLLYLKMYMSLLNYVILVKEVRIY